MRSPADTELQSGVRRFYREAVLASSGDNSVSVAPVIAACGPSRYLIAAGAWPDEEIRASAMEVLALLCRPHSFVLCSQGFPSPAPRLVGSTAIAATEPESVVFVVASDNGYIALVRQELLGRGADLTFGPEQLLGPELIDPLVREQLVSALDASRTHRMRRGEAGAADWAAARDSLAAAFGFTCVLSDAS